MAALAADANALTFAEICSSSPHSPTPGGLPDDHGVCPFSGACPVCSAFHLPRVAFHGASIVEAAAVTADFSLCDDFATSRPRHTGRQFARAPPI